MAIKAEERQIGTQPSDRLIREFKTQLPSPDMSGVANLGKVIGDIGEQEAVRTAKEEATSYANSLEFGRDEKGNFVKPVAPDEFGPMRREVFNDLINRRYTTDVLLDHDAAVADIYTKNKAAGGDPSAAAAKAQADMTGRLAGVDPASRPIIAQAMRKNLIQYDTGAKSEFYTRTLRAEIINNGEQITALSDRYVRATAAGNTGDADLALAEITDRRNKLKAAGFLTQDPEADKIFFSSIKASALVRREITSAVNNPQLDKGNFPSEINRLQRIVMGDAADDETAFGFKKTDFDNLDRATAAKIYQDLTRTSTDFRQQFAVSSQMQKIQTFLSNADSGIKNQTFGMPDDLLVMAFKQDIINVNKNRTLEGLPAISETSPEGMAYLVSRHGFLPGKLYDGIFSNLATRAPDQIELASQVYRNAEKMPDATGTGTASQVNNFGNAEDRNFLDHYIGLRTSGIDPANAVTQARQIIKDKEARRDSLGAEAAALQEYNRFKGREDAKPADLIKDIKNRTGIDIGKMPDDARAEFTKRVQRSISTAASYEKGVMVAADMFKKDWAIDPLSWKNQSDKYRDTAYVPKGQAFPIPLDGKNETVSQWMTPYLGPLLSNYAPKGKDSKGKEIEGTIQIVGISKAVPIASLEIGKNIFFQSTGRATYDPSIPWHQQSQVNPNFQVVYYDAKSSASAIIHAAPNAAGANVPLTLEPHAEAKAQHDAFAEAARANNVRANQLDRNSQTMFRQSSGTLSMEGFMAGTPQEGAVPPVVGLLNVPQPMKPIAYGRDGKPFSPPSNLDRATLSRVGAGRLQFDPNVPGGFTESPAVELFSPPNVDNLVPSILRDTVQRPQRRSSFDPASAPPAEFVQGGPVVLAGNQTVQISPKDRDLLIRTVMAEAGSEPPEGKAGVAYVVLNRLASGRFGNDVYSILTKKNQFEPWTKNPEKVMAYSPSTPGWRQAATIVDTMIAGGVSDPTNGATHFANRDIVAARQNTRALRWIDTMSNPTKIGRHTFGSAGVEGADLPAPGVRNTSFETESNTPEGFFVPGGNEDKETEFYRKQKLEKEHAAKLRDLYNQEQKGIIDKETSYQEGRKTSIEYYKKIYGTTTKSSTDKSTNTGDGMFAVYIEEKLPKMTESERKVSVTWNHASLFEFKSILDSRGAVRIPAKMIDDKKTADQILTEEVAKELGAFRKVLEDGGVILYKDKIS